MTTLFSENTRKIRLDSKADYLKIVESMRNFMFPDCPRSTDYEFFCFYVYIISLFKLGRIAFPIWAEKIESPDFLLCFDGQTIGLEHTNATTTSLQHAYSKLNECPEGSLVELPEYCSEQTSKETVLKGIRAPRERLQSSGWGDWGCENAWVKCFFDAIVKKTDLLNRDHFKKYTCNELIIYDDTPSVCPKLDYSVPKLKEEYKRFSRVADGVRYFEKIHLITSSTVIYDVMQEPRVVDIQKSALDS